MRSVVFWGKERLAVGTATTNTRDALLTSENLRVWCGT